MAAGEEKDTADKRINYFINFISQLTLHATFQDLMSEFNRVFSLNHRLEPRQRVESHHRLTEMTKSILLPGKAEVYARRIRARALLGDPGPSDEATGDRSDRAGRERDSQRTPAFTKGTVATRSTTTSPHPQSRPTARSPDECSGAELIDAKRLRYAITVEFCAVFIMKALCPVITLLCKPGLPLTAPKALAHDSSDLYFSFRFLSDEVVGLSDDWMTTDGWSRIVSRQLDTEPDHFRIMSDITEFTEITCEKVLYIILSICLNDFVVISCCLHYGVRVVLGVVGGCIRMGLSLSAQSCFEGFTSTYGKYKFHGQRRAATERCLTTASV
ncbi:hypothetical protein F2P81_003865 [Scophthalmus maximus]|uniref:Uncharacterized protein n=1 Tax=Scophthalmus maximus TaxID=52904 RepID=A0A6A4TDQ6_SCOMX|nr:hypothetical protein F2P81_003865 [Scophthalmus maximus]